MAALRLHRTADGLGATFPEDVLADLNVGEGDVLELVRTGGSLMLTPVDADFEAEMKAARQIMAENEAVLRVLAK